MNGLKKGDRVRVDSCAEHHGRHAIIADKLSDNRFRVDFDDETTAEFDTEDLRPVPNVETELTEREHDTVTNIWGRGASSDLRKESTEKLWEMEERVSEAVQLSYEDDDMESLGVLLSLELKITHVLSERMEQE